MLLAYGLPRLQLHTSVLCPNLSVPPDYPKESLFSLLCYSSPQTLLSASLLAVVSPTLQTLGKDSPPATELSGPFPGLYPLQHGIPPALPAEILLLLDATSQASVPLCGTPVTLAGGRAPSCGSLSVIRQPTHRDLNKCISSGIRSQGLTVVFKCSIYQIGVALNRTARAASEVSLESGIIQTVRVLRRRWGGSRGGRLSAELSPGNRCLTQVHAPQSCPRWKVGS